MKMKKINGIRRCRLCACEEDFNNFSHIFDDNPEMALEMKITKLLPVVVMPWDPMPHIICHKCIDKLNNFNDFYETSLKAERFLRSLHPTAPDNDLDDLDPVVEVMDPPILAKTPFKLPLKKRQGIPPSSGKLKEDNRSPEYIDIPQNPDDRQEIYSKRTLNCFIVNQISSKDSVYTCRDCFRTFTKQSSALTHSCVRLEDCAEIETIDLDEEGEKSLPPLKIRLFSVRSGLFVCYLCQAPFEEKAEVIEHIRRHILEDGKKSGRQRGKRRGRSLYESDNDEDWEDAYKKKTSRRRKKKCPGPPRKRGRPKTEETLEECRSGPCEKCSRNSPPKETVERTTQYSEISDNSEDEQQQEEQTPAINNPPVVPVTTDTIGVVETMNPDLQSSMLADEVRNPEPSDRQNLETEDISDEITILEEINNKTPTSLSACVFCDRIFATKDALISHQNKHRQGVPELKVELENQEMRPEEEEAYLCSICAMFFTSKKSLLDHEQFHPVEMDQMTHQSRIRIALAHEYQNREVEQGEGIGRGIITITVTAGEKKIPQIAII